MKLGQCPQILEEESILLKLIHKKVKNIHNHLKKAQSICIVKRML